MTSTSTPCHFCQGRRVIMLAADTCQPEREAPCPVCVGTTIATGVVSLQAVNPQETRARSREAVREVAVARAALTEIVRLNGGADWRGTRGIALEALGLAAPNDEQGTGFAVDALTADGGQEPQAEEVVIGEITQADREFAAGWIVINQDHAKLIRAGGWDGHPGVVAAMKHRLSEAGL